MIWNWQQAGWPQFTYNASLLDDFEKRLLLEMGVSFGAIKHLSEDDKRQLTIELISNEALKSSAIEGEYLNRDSLQSSICRQFGLITEFLIQKTKLYDQLRGQLNLRQQKALTRMFTEGPDGFTGGLNADKYRNMSGAPSATATRDLQDLVAKGALIRTGERKLLATI